MTIDLPAIFKYKTPNVAKLLDYGFVADDATKIAGAANTVDATSTAGAASANTTSWRKQVQLLRKQFTLEVVVGADGAVGYRVIDNALDEEYVLVHVESAQGSFVGKVRAACEKVLVDISGKCFDTEKLKAEQTKRLIAHVREKYGVEPEFLWDSSPSYGVFRRRDNDKWFGIIMTVDRSKVGLAGHGNMEIINLKARPEDVLSLLEQDGYYPAYHMNKKHWLSVNLEGCIPDAALYALVAASFALAGKR